MIDVKKTISSNGRDYTVYSLQKARDLGLADIDRLPKSLKVLLENQLRNENGQNVTWEDARAFSAWTRGKRSDREINWPGYSLAAILFRASLSNNGSDSG